MITKKITEEMVSHSLPVRERLFHIEKQDHPTFRPVEGDVHEIEPLSHDRLGTLTKKVLKISREIQNGGVESNTIRGNIKFSN